jgi:hypothetical protein
LLTQLIPAAVSTSSSNAETVYSTDGGSSIVIHDRPYTDPSRTVTFNGATLTQDTDVWFIQDRRHPAITSSVQLRHFNAGGEWWKNDPQWWHKNLDVWARRWGGSGQPNDLRINGILGMPVITDDTHHAIIEMTAYLFRQKDSAANVAFGPDGTILDISDLPTPVQAWILNWRVRTAVGII